MNAALRGASALTDQLAEGVHGVHNEVAHQEAAGPLVVFQRVDGTDEYTLGSSEAMVTLLYTVKAIARDPDPENNGGTSAKRRAELIAEAAYDALHDQALSVSGYTLVRCERSRMGPSFQSTEGGVRFRHVGQEFRLTLTS